MRSACERSRGHRCPAPGAPAALYRSQSTAYRMAVAGALASWGLRCTRSWWGARRAHGHHSQPGQQRERILVHGTFPKKALYGCTRQHGRLCQHGGRGGYYGLSLAVLRASSRRRVLTSNGEATASGGERAKALPFRRAQVWRRCACATGRLRTGAAVGPS